MVEIPEDAKLAAEEIVNELTFVPENYDLIINMIAKAILAERQRCADVCEGRAQEYDKIARRNADAGDPHEPEGKLSFEARRCARDILKQ